MKRVCPAEHTDKRLRLCKAVAFEWRALHEHDEHGIQAKRLTMRSGQTDGANARVLSPAHDIASADLDARQIDDAPVCLHGSLRVRLCAPAEAIRKPEGNGWDSMTAVPIV
jgi:hypothetical protein